MLNMADQEGRFLLPPHILKSWNSYFMNSVTALGCLLTNTEVRRRRVATTPSSLLLLTQRGPPIDYLSNGTTGSMRVRLYQPCRRCTVCRVCMRARFTAMRDCTAPRLIPRCAF